MKHPHAEMIIEWANDTSKVVQVRNQKLAKHLQRWTDANNPSWSEERDYRFKPREFNEGEWYQAVQKLADYDEHFVLKFINGCFYHGNDQYDAEQFAWIGESLGKLKFG